jgi:hypothetical protein
VNQSYRDYCKCEKNFSILIFFFECFAQQTAFSHCLCGFCCYATLSLCGSTAVTVLVRSHRCNTRSFNAKHANVAVC